MSESRKGPDIIRHKVDSTGKSFVRDIDVRANQMNTDDIPKVYSSGLTDIDESIKYHIENNILPKVLLNGRHIPVPVTFSSPEITSSINNKNTVRDSSGKLVYPIIVLKRTEFDTDAGRPRKLDANYAQNYYSYTQSYTRENRFDKFDLLNNRIPTKQRNLVAIPDFIKVSYVCYVYTDFVEHNNEIVQELKYASNSYWGSDDKSYRTYVGVIPTNTELSNENGGRICVSEIPMVVHGQILPDSILRHMSSRMKEFTKSVVNISIDENY